jgi:SAM-dependent methyltransferase
MSAEFDTIAHWTAQAAIDLGPSHFIPAACRGSGSPAALDWLIEHLDLSAGETLLDCGAGVGGPAAYVAERRSVRPVLVEPEAGACHAARRLFGHPVVQAAGSALPIATESFRAAWSLGVLCTMRAQTALLAELRRVVEPRGRIGLLVLVARTTEDFEKPEGNHFPTTDSLTTMIEDVGLSIEAWQDTASLPPASQQWVQRDEEVTAMLRERHGHTRAWRLAEQQGDLIGRLLAESMVTTELLVLRGR